MDGISGCVLRTQFGFDGIPALLVAEMMPPPFVDVMVQQEITSHKYDWHRRRNRFGWIHRE